MDTEKPAPVPTSLFAIEVHDAKTDELLHVIAHPIRATRAGTAIWEALRAYPFKIKHWRLEAVPVETHFPKIEAAA